MHAKKVRFTDPVAGPIQHEALSPDLINRIKKYRDLLGDADPGSLEDVIDSFRCDVRPEKEIAIWERIAHVFQNVAAGHKITDLTQRRQVLAALLLISNGADVAPAGTLTREQITELKYNF